MLIDGVINFGFVVLACVAGVIACTWMMRTGIVDAPDGGRKTQDRPVARLGGVAMAIGILLGVFVGSLVFAALFAAEPSQILQALLRETVTDWGVVLGFTAIAFLVGLWDDVWTANTKVKLVLFAVACGWAAWTGLQPEALNTPLGMIDAPGVLVAGSALWLLVFTNAANFMDGSNGLSIGCLLIMLIGLGVIAVVKGTMQLPFWGFATIGAMLGFLSLNLRGQIYAGDAGSLGLGSLFAGLGLVAGLEVWTIATLALPFLIDVLLTLAWRAKHGRNLLSAHLDHAYQRLITAGWSHLETALLYWGLTVTAGLIAYIGARAGGAAPFAVFWTLTLAGSLIWILHRRATKRDDLSDETVRPESLGA